VFVAKLMVVSHGWRIGKRENVFFLLLCRESVFPFSFCVKKHKQLITKEGEGKRAKEKLEREGRSHERI
jgi:hypothetical protein